jgi:hypothetical protein
MEALVVDYRFYRGHVVGFRRSVPKTYIEPCFCLSLGCGVITTPQAARYLNARNAKILQMSLSPHVLQFLGWIA